MPDIITNHTALIEEYLINRELADSSKVIYRCIIHSFFKFIINCGKDARRPSSPDAIAFKVMLEQSGKSSFTVNLYITSLKTFFTWLQKDGKYDKIPTAGLKRLKKHIGFTKLPLTIEQMNGLLDSINTDNLKGKRDYTMIMLALTTGLRTNEIATITLEDIEGCIVKIKGKGHTTKDQTITIPESVKELINDYITARLEEEEVTDHSPLFVSHAGRKPVLLTGNEIGKIIKIRLVQAGLVDKKITAHSLRHTTAVNLINEGVDLPYIQRFMRHANISTTQIYTKRGEYEMLNKIKPQEMLSKLIQKKAMVQ